MNEQNKNRNNIPDWDTPWRFSKIGYAKNYIIETGLYLNNLIKCNKRNKLIMLPCGTKKENPASLLRSYNLGRELELMHNWEVTIIPPRLTLNQRKRIISMIKPSLIVMQMERHPLNRPKLYNESPIIFDIDDADFLWPHAKDLLKDACRNSAAIVAGSRYVANWCKQYNSNVEIIWTGGPVLYRDPFNNQNIRKNIVAWGHSRPHDYPKEMEFIENVLKRISKNESFEFWIFGVVDKNKFKDYVQRINKIGINVKLFSLMDYKRYTQTLLNVSVGLQVMSDENEFSKGKSFGKILNYLSAGIAVVATSDGDHPLFFKSGQNGILANTVEEFADAITYLLNNPQQRLRMAKEGFNDFKNNLSTEAFAKKYDTFLRFFI